VLHSEYEERGLVDAQAYVLIAIVVLAVAFAIGLRRGRGEQRGRLTPLAGIAFALVLAGIVFGEHRLLSYSLMGAGIALAVVDILWRSRHRAV
jgi:uncharacterized membrane protein